MEENEIETDKIQQLERIQRARTEYNALEKRFNALEAQRQTIHDSPEFQLLGDKDRSELFKNPYEMPKEATEAIAAINTTMAAQPLEEAVNKINIVDLYNVAIRHLNASIQKASETLKADKLTLAQRIQEKRQKSEISKEDLDKLDSLGDVLKEDEDQQTPPVGKTFWEWAGSLNPAHQKILYEILRDEGSYKKFNNKSDEILQLYNAKRDIEKQLLLDHFMLFTPFTNEERELIIQLLNEAFVANGIKATYYPLPASSGLNPNAAAAAGGGTKRSKTRDLEYYFHAFQMAKAALEKHEGKALMQRLDDQGGLLHDFVRKTLENETRNHKHATQRIAIEFALKDFYALHKVIEKLLELLQTNTDQKDAQKFKHYLEKALSILESLEEHAHEGKWDAKQEQALHTTLFHMERFGKSILQEHNKKKPFVSMPPPVALPVALPVAVAHGGASVHIGIGMFLYVIIAFSMLMSISILHFAVPTKKESSMLTWWAGLIGFYTVLFTGLTWLVLLLIDGHEYHLIYTHILLVFILGIVLYTIGKWTMDERRAPQSHIRKLVYIGGVMMAGVLIIVHHFVEE